MKRKAILALLLAFALSFCLVACKPKGSYSLCKDGHNLVDFPLVPETCLEDGVAAHSECTRCHAIFDENGNRVSLGQLTLPAACRPDGVWLFDETEHYQTCLVCSQKTLVEKHSFANGVCSVCGTVKESGECHHQGGKATCLEKAICELCGKPYGKLAEHEYAAIVSESAFASAPTCCSGALYYKTCSVCKKINKDLTFVFGGPVAANHLFVVNEAETNENHHTLVCSLCKISVTSPHTGGEGGSCLDLLLCPDCGHQFLASPHDFSLKIVSDECLVTPATCQTPAIYYYSCLVCKTPGTSTTFSSGPVADHHYENGHCVWCGKEE